jgi:hypothetical protein
MEKLNEITSVCLLLVITGSKFNFSVSKSFKLKQINQLYEFLFNAYCVNKCNLFF